MGTHANRCLRAIALGILALVASACGGGTANVSDNAETALPFSAPAWPALPPSRDVSVTTPLTQTGSQAFQKSAGAQINGTDLQLTAANYQVQYGIYRFGTGGDPTLSLSVGVFNTASHYFVGLSDYTAQHWVISGPNSGSKLFSLSGHNFTSPSGDFYCFVASYGGGQNCRLQTLTLNVDHVATTATLSGTITSGANGLSGVTVDLTGAAVASTTTDAQGKYSFAGLLDGSYTVTPSKSGYSFTPSSIDKLVQGTNVTGVDFVGSAATTYMISGHVADGANNPLSGVTLSLVGPPSAQTSTDSNGDYTFNSVVDGDNYTLTPTLTGYTFTPPSRSFQMHSNRSGVDFTGSNGSGSGVQVWGLVLNGAGDPVQDVSVNLSGVGDATTDVTGKYVFNNVSNGGYTVTPSTASGRSFKPVSQTATVSGSDVHVPDFLSIPHYDNGDHEIRDFVYAHCSTCHTTDNPPSGNVYMTPYNKAKNNANSAELAIQLNIMPQSPQPPLSDAQKALFKAWVDNSTPD
jgi:hypothetical protein